MPGDNMALRPDLIILNEVRAEAFIVDVTVPFEGEVFHMARRAKEISMRT